MDIEMIRRLRDNMKHDIKKLIRAFEKETSVEISEINIEKTYVKEESTGKEFLIDLDVDITIEI